MRFLKIKSFGFFETRYNCAMPIQLRKPSQFELFPGSAANPQERAKGPHLFKNLTLSSEHIIVLGIFLLMSWVLFYSLGIEQGRKVLPTDLTVSVASAPVKPAEVVKPSVPVTTSSNSTAAVTPIQAAPAKPSPVETQRVILPKPVATPETPADTALIRDDQSDDIYTIQVASYKTNESAQREALRLKQKGFEVYVLPKGSHMIICVGKFVEKEEAKRFLNKLRGKYNDCLVRRI